MTDFDSIDALLAEAGREVPLPPAEQRRALREGLSLSRAQVARALGVSPSTVAGWESGRDPSGEVREKYAYFLDGAHAKLRSHAQARAEGEADARPASADAAPVQTEPETAASGDARARGGAGHAGDAGDGEVLPVPQPCVLCGAPARHQVAGFPQHLDPGECASARPGTPHPVSPGPEALPPVPAASEPPHPAPAGAEAPEPASAAPDAPTPAPPPPGTGENTAAPSAPRSARGTSAGRVASAGVPIAPQGRRVRAASDDPDLIGRAVVDVLAQHSGDLEAASAALVRRAIPDAMALLDATRKGGRYDVVAHPWLPDILRKQTARGADQIWEARPKWTRPRLPAGRHEVTALDVNGAYLSALKTHLPIGQLEYSSGDHHDRRRAGVHLITPPDWEHGDVLPNPLGSRDEPGPLWVTEPTLRLLLRLAGPKYGLCDPPRIHESWTSGATENLLEKFRVTLKDARDRAIAEDDEVTGEYVKAMYSKFVSTMGESNYNRELYRPDWMHLIRSQAFANLWWKAHRAWDEGLMVVRVMGTDELHLTGDWRAVFPEGRGVSEVKVKDVYTVGDDDGPDDSRP